jgi:hypothetical protein
MVRIPTTPRLLAALAAVALVVCPTQADERGGRDPRQADPELQGTLKKLDAKIGTITIISGGRDQGADRNLNLLEAVAVEIDGKPAKLDALAEGMQVVLKVSETTGDVVAIRAEGRTLRGQLREVDADKQRIVVGNERQSPSYPVTAATRITVEGREVRLADLRPGASVALRLSADGKSLLAIMVGQGEPERRGERRPAVADERERRVADERERRAAEGRGRGAPQLRGAVKGIDPAGKTLTLTVLQDGIELTGVFTLADTTTVQVGRQQGQLADLKPGTPVVLQLAEDRKTLVSVHVVVGERR